MVGTQNITPKSMFKVKSNQSDRPLMMDEPELPEVPDVDKTLVRNILYTTWALHTNSDSCISWQVQTKSDGYLILISFGQNFCITMQDMQIVHDVNPLRIGSMCIRSPEQNVSCLAETPCCLSSSSPTSVAVGDKVPRKVSATLVIKVLDHQQPVSITETEVVRVRKKSRGLFSIMTGSNSKSKAAHN